MLSPELASLLRCPRCRGSLTALAAPEGLHCPRCALLYPVTDGIPNMLIEEARPFEAAPRS